MGFRASMQKAMCSSRSTPRAAAPLMMSSRFTLRAKALSFILFRTDLVSTSASDLPGLIKRDSGDEAGEFVAGEESLFHGRVAGHAGVFGVRHDGAADFVGVSALFQDLVALVRMVLEAGPAFVIEVVNQSDDAPEVFVFGRIHLPTCGRRRACRLRRPARVCANFPTG